MEVSVHGSVLLSQVARKLRQAGRQDLMRQMTRGLQRSVAPLTTAVRAEVPKTMPSGYAPVLAADLRLKTSIRTRGDSAGLRIVAVAPTKSDERDVAALNRGLLRHPRFGDRDDWYDQKVRSGFFTRPLLAGAPTVRPQLEQAIRDTLNKIAEG